MAKVWRKALIQWQEPEAAGSAWHQPGDVYEIDTDKVFDDADLLRLKTHIECDPPEPPQKPARAPKVTAEPTESEVQ